MTNKNIKIALLLGGTSSEREVSLSSGKSIYFTLKEAGYNVKLVDPAFGLNQPEKEEDFFTIKQLPKIQNENYIETVNSSLFDDVDLAFIALHGKWGEDGVIQSLLELRGIKYTGSGVLASAIAMDKCVSKILFQHFDVATPNWIMINARDYNIEKVTERIKKLFGFPCIVKPNDQGSTIGFSLVRNSSEVKGAVDLAFSYSDKILIEEFISGREIGVTVLDHTPLPVLEIKPRHNSYDYECKYTSGMSEYIVPAQIPELVANHLKQQALLAFNAIGGTGYGRMDFRLTEDMKCYCLEVNTLPGMTSTSLVPKMAKAAGISFIELLEKIIEQSIK